MRNGLEERMHEYIRELATDHGRRTAAGRPRLPSIVNRPFFSTFHQGEPPCNPKFLKHPPPRGSVFTRT
jgi:hypothetical protein